MGATTFITESNGPDPQEAFTSAVRSAAWEHGHGGYTGTIAEKRSFRVLVELPLALEEAQGLARRMLADDDERISDKWGPAGAVALGDGLEVEGWLFFGWASE